MGPHSTRRRAPGGDRDALAAPSRTKLARASAPPSMYFLPAEHRRIHPSASSPPRLEDLPPSIRSRSVVIDRSLRAAAGGWDHSIDSEVAGVGRCRAHVEVDRWFR